VIPALRYIGAKAVLFHHIVLNPVNVRMVIIASLQLKTQGPAHRADTRADYIIASLQLKTQGPAHRADTRADYIVHPPNNCCSFDRLASARWPRNALAGPYSSARSVSTPDKLPSCPLLETISTPTRTHRTRCLCAGHWSSNLGISE